MSTKTPAPSSSYQSFFREIALDPSDMDRYKSNQSVSQEDEDEIDRKIKEVQTDILVRIFQLAHEHLTDIQKRVFQLKVFGNKSFIDIATIRQDEYSCWESAYTASYYAAHGQKNYSNTRGTFGKVYGGYIKKLQKVAKNDSKIQDLLHQIRRLQSER